MLKFNCNINVSGGLFLGRRKMNKEFHVALSGSGFAEGTKAHPFRTISKAAMVAGTGDKVIVHAGEYREWVKPENSG
jgi:alpha-N-arabinofuranosidase